MTEEIDHTAILGKVVCSHCGYEVDEVDTEGMFYTEDGVEVECDECHEPFTCYGSVTWFFTTRKGHVETEARRGRQEQIRQKWKENPPVKHYEEES